MLRASVPEAAINEDGNARPCEEHVRPTAGETRQRLIDPEAEAPAMQLTTEPQLRLRVPTPLSRHARGGARRGGTGGVSAAGYG